MNKKILEEIAQITLELRLPSFRKNIQSVLTDSLKQNDAYERVILTLIQAEPLQEILLRVHYPIHK